MTQATKPFAPLPPAQHAAMHRLAIGASPLDIVAKYSMSETKAAIVALIKSGHITEHPYAATPKGWTYIKAAFGTWDEP